MASSSVLCVLELRPMVAKRIEVRKPRGRSLGPATGENNCSDARRPAFALVLWSGPMSYEAPFAGLRVADLSQGIAGPYCAMLLAQHGADVIKVEPPAGDWSRTLGVRHGDQSAFSIAANLGKRSIVVDLKEERGTRIVRHLTEQADV